MKKIKSLLAGLMVVSLCVPGLLQANDGERLHGVRAGFQSAGIFDGGSSVGDPIRTFYVGFDNDTKLSGPLHFGSGLQYFQNGATNIISNDDKLVLHYLGLPMHLKVKLGPVFALAGASANFKIAQTYKVDGEKMDFDKQNWFDVPLHAGVGVKIAMFVVEARYYWGMLELNDGGVKSQYFQVGAGFLF